MSNSVLLIMTDSWNSPNPTDYIASLPAALVAISPSDMSHDRFSCAFLGCVFSQNVEPCVNLFKWADDTTTNNNNSDELV